MPIFPENLCRTRCFDERMMEVAMESEETQASVASTVKGKIVALAGGFGFLKFEVHYINLDF